MGIPVSLSAPGVPAPPWYALYTRHQHEKTVAHILTHKGFSVFLPLYDAEHRWKDRNKKVSLPLFPCYVFMRGGIERRLDVLITPGIHRFIEVAGQPAAIPEHEIDAIRQVLERDISIQPFPFLKCGEWVRVKCGPLEGIEGILVRKKNLSRLVLSVELLGKSAAVEVDASMVEGIAYRPAKAATHQYSATYRPTTSTGVSGRAVTGVKWRG